MRDDQDEDDDMIGLLAPDGAGPARPLDPRASAALISSALDAALAPGGSGDNGGAGSSGGAGGSGGAAAGGTAKLVLAIAAVAAIGLVAVVAWRLQSDPSSDDGSSSAVRAPDTAQPDPSSDDGSSSDPSSDDGSSSRPDPSSDDGSNSGVRAPDTAQPDPSSDDGSELDEIAMDPAVARVPRKPRKPAATAQDLLAEANAARKERDWREADRTYGEVIAQFPKTGAAQAALVASATIRLQHLNDASGAIARFKRALKIAAGGPLAEEARHGLAEAHRARGDRDAEAAALDEFLHHHADSPLAPAARARRAKLP